MVKKENSNIRRNQEKKEREGTKQLFSYKVFGNNLKKAREGHYSQKDLAEEAKKYGDVSLSESTIKACEQGKANISAQALYVLSDIFDKSMDELVSRNFKVEDKKSIIGTCTGLTNKSIKFLQGKKKEKDINKKTASRVKIINNTTFHLNEIDAVNYLLENSNIFSIFIRDVKRVFCEIVELEENENLKIQQLKNMYIDFCKSKNVNSLENGRLKQIYAKLDSGERINQLTINDVKKLYISLYKQEPNEDNKQHYKQTQKIQREIQDIRQKKDDLINYSSFSIYNSICKDFRKYINKLRNENKK